MKSYSFLKKYLLAATATAALLFSACDLDEHPTSFVGPKEYYKTRAQCLAGLNACYIPINSIYDYCFLIMTEGVTDLMYIASGTKDAQLDISPAKPLNGQKIWTQCYKGVMYCNSTIAAIERSPLNDIKEASEADKLPLLAEGVVIRSFYYWLLTCIFGDVPFYTKEVADQQVMQEIAHMGRMPAKETRDYLIDELQRYVPSMDQVRSSEVADNRMGAAMGWMMIAKLAQWNHRWDDALEALGELEKIYGDLQQYPLDDIMFRNKNTPESIFEVQRTYTPGGLAVTTNVAAITTPYHNGKGIYDGVGSKDVIPEDIMAVYEHLKDETPRHNFTLSINDDVTGLSLAPVPVPEMPGKLVSCKFWGFGSDGTVGANKSAIKIIGDHTNLYAQGYFAYDSKKSGGVTISHLRFGEDPIRKPYLIRKADYIACHRPSYIYKYDLLRGFKPGGIFLLNSPWRKEDLERVLPAAMKRKLAALHARFYIIDAFEIAKKIGLGGRINMIMQAAFFHLTHIIPDEDAVKYLKESNEKSYGRKGQNVVDMNNAAVDAGMTGMEEVEVPASWEHATTGGSIARVARPDFVKNVCDVMNRQEGDDLPVSTWKGLEDGTFPSGTSKYERPAAAINIPEWIPENCIECNQCSVVCPHATIRPVLVTEEEAEKAPEGFIVKEFRGPVKGLKFRIIIDPEDCYGCGICANTCPAPKKALVMKPAETQLSKQNLWDYAMKLPARKNPLGKGNLRSAQFEPTYFEFSGACAGCGETPYINMVTRLFGDRMMIANATGCSSIYGASSPSMPYTKNAKGQGPAWANSLFEDNAEYGLGMHLGEAKLRDRLTGKLKEALPSADETVKNAIEEWLDKKDVGNGTRDRADKLEEALTAEVAAHPEYKELLDLKDHFVKKSQWIFGGDGWAYDIGFGGLDQVLASGEDVNVLVLDTEVYSNTGGQSSKSTPAAAIAKFAASGKKTKKKDLGMIAVSYGYIYVAQIALGADMNQAFKAISEAEAYPGPSLIIAYAPCINHGLKAGMGKSSEEEKRAVECGYWCNWRYNPTLLEQGKNPFHLDSREPKGNFRDYLMGEVRFASLAKLFPDKAEELFEKTERDAKQRRENYVRIQKSYDMELAAKAEKK